MRIELVGFGNGDIEKGQNRMMVLPGIGFFSSFNIEICNEMETHKIFSKELVVILTTMRFFVLFLITGF